MSLSDRTAAWVSALVYTGLALALALAFTLLAPRAAPGDAVARYGGAAWVFLLAMIVIMPTFAPLLRRWLTATPTPRPSAGGERMAAAPPGEESARDPVCGMVVNRAGAAATSQYAGRTVYFCALGCKERFDRAPEQFPLD